MKKIHLPSLLFLMALLAGCGSADEPQEQLSPQQQYDSNCPQPHPQVKQTTRICEKD